jgi:predicted hotdog family 3-hydroxylacyl-ACP dehydratase
VYGGQINHKPRSGFLVSLRDVSCKTMRLDNLQDNLIINAEKLMGDETRVMYQFSIQAAGAEIISGRATVILDAEQGTL